MLLTINITTYMLRFRKKLNCFFIVAYIDEAESDIVKYRRTLRMLHAH